MRNRVDYGIDAPGVIQKLIFGGALLAVFYVSLGYGLYIYLPFFWVLVIAYIIGISTFVCMAGFALFMIWSSKVGKLWQRDLLLNKIVWHGNEHVLDVGCGRGLLLIGVAKKLTFDGRAVGIDIWSQEDLGDNSASATYENVKIEGVEQQVEIQTGDVRKLLFANDSFDAVVSSLVIHNLNAKADREVALKEMLRVLKPGGTLLLQDIFYTKEYFDYLQQYKNLQVSISALSWYIFPPVRMIIVIKM